MVDTQRNPNTWVRDISERIFFFTRANVAILYDTVMIMLLMIILKSSQFLLQ